MPVGTMDQILAAKAEQEDELKTLRAQLGEANTKGHDERAENLKRAIARREAAIGMLDEEAHVRDMIDRNGAVGESGAEPGATDGLSPAVGAKTFDYHPLAYDAGTIDRLQSAMNTKSAGRFKPVVSRLQKAALTTATYGQPMAWASNVPGPPRLLHVVAKVPQSPIDAVAAEIQQLTLPTAVAGVGENVTVPEYATSAAGTVTLLRFGRFTDTSLESGVGTTASAVINMHTIGIAKDLDKVLIDAVNTAAGTAVAFTADVPAAIRKAQALVIDNTAAAAAGNLVILVHPDNAALLQDVAPIGGSTIAEPFQKFSGSIVYPSSAVPTGFVIVANLSAGTRYFQAMGIGTQTFQDVKTGTLTTSTWTVAGYGVGITAGFASKVDVLTP